MRSPLAATHTPPASDTNPGHRGSQPSTLPSRKPEQAGRSFLEEAPVYLRRKTVLRGLRWENCCPPKKRLAKKSSTDRNLKPRESWDIKQGPSQLGPSFRRQRSQNCEANRRQRNAPEQCCLPACAGQEGGARAAGGRMTHCSENSLFQTSGQAAPREAQAGTLGAQHTECGLATPGSPRRWACRLGAFGVLCSFLVLHIN